MRKIALVGKGITYDTGGLQIKGKSGMPGMKTDMGGAAATLGAFKALCQLRRSTSSFTSCCASPRTRWVPARFDPTTSSRPSRVEPWRLTTPTPRDV